MLTPSGSQVHPEEPRPLCSQDVSPYHSPIRICRRNQHPSRSAESRGEVCWHDFSSTCAQRTAEGKKNQLSPKGPRVRQQCGLDKMKGWFVIRINPRLLSLPSRCKKERAKSLGKKSLSNTSPPPAPIFQHTAYPCILPGLPGYRPHSMLSICCT